MPLQTPCSAPPATASSASPTPTHSTLAASLAEEMHSPTAILVSVLMMSMASCPSSSFLFFSFSSRARQRSKSLRSEYAIARVFTEGDGVECVEVSVEVSEVNAYVSCVETC